MRMLFWRTQHQPPVKLKCNSVIIRPLKIADYFVKIYLDLYVPVFARVMEDCIHVSAGTSFLPVIFLVNMWSPLSVWCTAESRLLETASSWPSVPLRIVNDNENFLTSLAATFSRVVSPTVSLSVMTAMKTNHQKWFDKLSCYKTKWNRQGLLKSWTQKILCKYQYKVN